MYIYRADVLISFICVLIHACAFPSSQAQECGDNPIKQVLLVAKSTGRTLSHVLTLLKEIDNPAYEKLARKFRTYAACVGLVDTGYFRKRSSTENELEEPALRMRRGNDLEKYVGGLDRFNSDLDFDSEVDSTMYFQDAHPKFDLQLERDLQSNLDLDNELDEEIGSNWDPFQIENMDDETGSYIVNVRREKKKSDTYENKRRYNVDRLKKWLYGPYRNYMNSYYIRWNLLWPLTKEDV